MKIILPFKTPTINHLYYHMKNIKVLTNEARELRKEIQEIISKSCNHEEIKELEDKIEDLNDVMLMREAELNDDGVRHTTEEVLELLKEDTP